MIRRMRTEDVSQVVTAHLASFPGFFLSFLGPRFLRVYYLGVCAASESIAFVYLFDKGKLGGFVAGTSNPQGFYRRLLKRAWCQFVLASIGAVVQKPQTIPRIARALFHPYQIPYGNEVAGLYSIGVLPELQRTGVGKRLVSSFLDEVRHKGCTRVVLTTDRDCNDQVNHFYRSLGFTVERQYETPEGRRMNEYWIDVKP